MNKNTLLKNKVLNILTENLYATIATASDDGKPWISNVYFAFDKYFNIYWYSPVNSKHSKLIKTNPRVALSIFNSTSTGEEVDAVYIQAKAYEIDNPYELLKALAIYSKKLIKTNFNTKKEINEIINKIEDFQFNSPIKMYIAKPNKIWKLAPSKVFNGKYVDSKIELKI